ncbi:MAG: hypothetical protein QXH86_07670 [Ignisphaera sp.]
MKVSDVVKIAARGVYDQTINCVKYNLRCLDPPCLTSGMLDSYGLHNYSAKTSFWRAVENIISKYNGVEIYRSKFGSFKLFLHHGIEEAYRIENTNIYVDALDCDLVNCGITPRSHVLRVYLEGAYSDRVVLKINVVTMAKIAISENPYFKDCLEVFASDPLSPASILTLTKCIAATLYRHQRIYEILFAKKPRSAMDIIRQSPLIRRFADIYKEFEESA